MKRSIDPSTARCSITGVAVALSAVTYFNPKRSGIAQSICTVASVHERSSTSRKSKPIFGP